MYVHLVVLTVGLRAQTAFTVILLGLNNDRARRMARFAHAWRVGGAQLVWQAARGCVPVGHRRALLAVGRAAAAWRVRIRAKRPLSSQMVLAGPGSRGIADRPGGGQAIMSI